jgi:hypothetical protein
MEGLHLAHGVSGLRSPFIVCSHSKVYDDAPLASNGSTHPGGVIKVKNELQEAKVLPISNRHAKFFCGSSGVCLFPPWASIFKTRIYPPLVFSDRSMSIEP